MVSLLQWLEGDGRPSLQWLYCAGADDGQPTALVPLTDEQEDAMEATAFHDLLRCCGLYPPSTEQV